MPKSIYSIQQEELQKLLRHIRVDSGLTQSELAKRIGQPQSYVSKYESGERLLDLVELRRICKAMKTPLIDVVRKWEGASL